MPEIRSIDSLGNLLEGSQYIGYYDSLTEKCYLVDGTETHCPSIDTSYVKQPTIKSNPTYWWVALIGFIIAIILLVWWLSKKK